MPINRDELSKEMVMAAMQCKDADIGLTKEEAEAYLAEWDDFELDADRLKAVAGGSYDKTNDYASKCPLYGHR